MASRKLGLPKNGLKRRKSIKISAGGVRCIAPLSRDQTLTFYELLSLFRKALEMMIVTAKTAILQTPLPSENSFHDGQT